MVQRKILIPHPELLAIRGASGGALAPDVRTPRTERGVDDVADCLAQRFSANVAAEHVAQIGNAFPMVAIGDAFDAGIGSESVQAQQQTSLERFGVESFMRR